MDEASVTIAAPPDRVWELVTDVTNMGRWSPGNTGGKWVGGAKGPAEGARFIGFNKRGLMRWPTRCTIVECVPTERFAFQVAENNMQWGWRLAPTSDGGTTLTQWRNRVSPPSAVVNAFATALFRGKVDEEMVDGMHRTLAKIKSQLESPA
ncbi:MAG TPA: SRPBCC family protein [Pseudonocardia sp.]